MERRQFFKIVGLAAISSGLLTKEVLASNGDWFKKYKKVQLVDANRNAIKASGLKEDESYIFHYPMVGTPAFLINLPGGTKKVSVPTSEGSEYGWDDGVGSDKSVVAFSAICAHGLAHPIKGSSSIGYYGDNSSGDPKKGRKRVLYCKAHESTYDLTAGGKNIAGSSIRPQATVVMEEDSAGNIYAVGMKGELLFDDYFKMKEVKKRLTKELGKWRKGKKVVKKTSQVVVASAY